MSQPLYIISIPGFNWATNSRDTTKNLDAWVGPATKASGVPMAWHYDYGSYSEGMIIVSVEGDLEAEQAALRALRQGVKPGWNIDFGFPHVNVVLRENETDE